MLLWKKVHLSPKLQIVIIRWIILTDATRRMRSCFVFVLPKHMPQSPWRIVRMITQPMSPLHSTPNTRIMKINTRAVWPHITTNCVTTWENRISPGDTPATQLRSSRLSILSIISADDVSATARKKTMLSTKINFKKLHLGKDFLKNNSTWEKKELKFLWWFWFIKGIKIYLSTFQK